MFLKNKILAISRTSQTLTSSRGPVRSLRVQLMLWYGGLIALSLILYASLVLWLTISSINQSVSHTIEADAKVAVVNIRQKLQHNPPYWPEHPLPAPIDLNQDSNITVAAFDMRGVQRCCSTNSDTRFSQNSNAVKAIHMVMQTGELQLYDTGTVARDHMKIGAYPIYAPHSYTSNSSEHMIGVLLIIKPLDDMDKTIVLLQALLGLAGLAVLTVALVGGWAIATNVLRPLAGIVRTARAIASTVHGTHVGNLSQRVQRPRGHDEMALVVDTFNEMLAALESATQAQRRFVADASHELRAPLTTIQGNLAFLQRHFDELPTEERRMMLMDAHGETLRLARLVDELLLLARSDANTGKAVTPQKEVEADNHLEYKDELVELDHTLIQLVRQLRGRLRVEGSKLKIEIGHIEPVRVRGDEEDIRRVMLILLDNALKYTPMNEENEGGQITVSLERVEEEAVVHVSDTGIGIDSADLPHIFERFYRADRARTRQGTGLGLSIAQTLVEQLGGRITAQSVPGEGSTFSFWLPLA
ncbi:HAMP domain-containing histidine kinase [Ktedonosporobacter rubrisoli]|uniref:histidine kinase n=1 Tax=Ktedonosporobacter rubrisoli TaxID=2509675 RepID=A0A4P6JQZ7_KTERU|nr:HAMP domain-containing sensor histidine kinase [Ktedonosporobacter rubrisoli]QBD77867.1 HAMP domain-containing histidine kinase [Ktedonosporobacter rubrisoli]